jgi:hypothetical protein
MFKAGFAEMKQNFVPFGLISLAKNQTSYKFKFSGRENSKMTSF